ncbi:collagen alpha-1(I) chain-like [Ochotona princeps]|uniref:collagen alpha-1(I) chain-like n=1 Tax=Ochotona princeps TaxID=9978 RepID=UPI002714A415|nr:collagen alpha-1(I) chain-like [Ochotona princeps]
MPRRRTQSAGFPSPSSAARVLRRARAAAWDKRRGRRELGAPASVRPQPPRRPCAHRHAQRQKGAGSQRGGEWRRRRPASAARRRGPPASAGKEGPRGRAPQAGAGAGPAAGGQVSCGPAPAGPAPGGPGAPPAPRPAGSSGRAGPGPIPPP